MYVADPPRGVPATPGDATPNRPSPSSLSNSRVSDVVVILILKSALLGFPARPAAKANRRDPASGVPTGKKSASPAGVIDPSTPHAGGVTPDGELFGSVSRKQRLASIVNGPPLVETFSSTYT